MLRFLLILFLFLPSEAWSQTVQAGLSYDGGAVQLVISVRTTGDISGEDLTGAIVTLRYPTAEGTVLGDVTSAFGFAQQGGTATSGSFTYVVYTANPTGVTLTGLNAADAEIELLRVAVTSGAGTANSVELAPRTTAPQVGGSDEFTFETNNVNFRDNFATPYFTSTTTLPVELAIFEALADGTDRITITWSTATETNNAGFHIERMALVEGEAGAESSTPSWEAVAWIEGTGTTTEAQAYRYEDAMLPFEAHTLRYRLRQVDYDGTASYSLEVEVTPGLPEAFALLPTFPNPFTTSTTVHYALREPGPVRLILYDTLGREHLRLLDGEQRAGRHRLTLNARTLASGLYHLRLEAGSFIQTQPLVIVR
ncbi:MAG: hypothetical protein RhofKO_22260 [Rhodothermales bacterium]